jgi:hypothetical protein
MQPVRDVYSKRLLFKPIWYLLNINTQDDLKSLKNDVMR